MERRRGTKGNWERKEIPKNDSVPEHDVVVLRGATNARRRILLEPLEIPHQPLPRWG